MDHHQRRMLVLVLLRIILLRVRAFLFMSMMHQRRIKLRNLRRREVVRYSLLSKLPSIREHMDKLTLKNDINSIKNLRMDRECFDKLCWVLREVGGLHEEKYVSLREQVTLFIKIMAHHDTNRVLGFYWQRSGHTISQYFGKALNALLKASELFLDTPSPVAEENCNCHEPWTYFQGCLEALDDTLIVTVPVADQARYRPRNGRININVLGVCDINMKFIYLLCGWEGSAADGRVLRDAMFRPTPNGLKIPKGNYYLVDSGYANSEGFFAPYRGRRYHLKEWETGKAVPQDHEELFNVKHSRAHSIIEWAFAKLKNQWKILKRPSNYPIKIQNRIIMACALLNNFIRRHMPDDPIINSSDDEDDSSHDDDDGDDGPPLKCIDGLGNSAEWNQFRDQIAMEMWNNYCAR